MGPVVRFVVGWPPGIPILERESTARLLIVFGYQLGLTDLCADDQRPLFQHHPTNSSSYLPSSELDRRSERRRDLPTLALRIQSTFPFFRRVLIVRWEVKVGYSFSWLKALFCIVWIRWCLWSISLCFPRRDKASFFYCLGWSIRIGLIWWKTRTSTYLRSAPHLSLP